MFKAACQKDASRISNGAQVVLCILRSFLPSNTLLLRCEGLEHCLSLHFMARNWNSVRTHIAELESTPQFPSQDYIINPEISLLFLLIGDVYPLLTSNRVKNTCACSNTAHSGNGSNLMLAVAHVIFMRMLFKETSDFKNTSGFIFFSFLKFSLNSSVLRLLLERDEEQVLYEYVWFNYCFVCIFFTRRVSSIILFKGSLEQMPHIQFIYFLLKTRPWVSAILTCTLSHMSAFYGHFPFATVISYVSLTFCII